MRDLNHQFGGIVKTFREQRRWSQETLAATAGLNRTYLGEVERGSAMPSLATVAKLAEALDLSLAELLATCQPTKSSTHHDP